VIIFVIVAGAKGAVRQPSHAAAHQMILIEVEFQKRNSNSPIGGIQVVLQTEIGRMRCDQSRGFYAESSNLEEWTGRKSWR
jgi:hypothetical protein